ncbi:Nephrocystin-3 [Paramuricea clavata]|uniref:Nephrocystin-3, partial n=1 Tax=Paramuricea clavata TaxID=317549 RepID=A0A7D9L2W8_PARCT|nr:Nephrocystin-3 [Paramuricea clavata]
MVPHFIGRQEKVEDILRALTSTSARLVSVSGLPGFGKTSLAIAVGHQLRQLGLPVYFLSLRSVKTAEELISDLLNTFAHASSDVTGRERSKLCGLLSAIPSNIYIILDNADDLFASSGGTRQDVLDLLEKIFTHCKNVSFLLTTRISLQSVLGRKFAAHTSVGVTSLDRKSSQMLVQELVPTADESECCRVAEVCGDVPLAIKLLCSQIVDEKKSISQFLDHFSRSSKKLADLLDDPDAPDDQRLNVLLESYFKRLSQEEQESFVCLSVLVSEVFDEQAAVNVIGGDEETAKKTLLRLKRKSLVEANSSEAGLFSFHPLIKSFGSEKGADDMKEIAREAQKRFLSYYVKLFEDLNNQFLAGNSLLAFHDFEFNKENMMHSLSEGLQNEGVCHAIFDVLSNADLFLDTIFYFQHAQIFQKIYKLAIAKAKEQRKFKAVHQLLIAKAFGEITWCDGAALPLLKEAEEIEKQNPLLPSEVAMGKRMCYQGIQLLMHKAIAKGGKMIEKGVSLLSSENTVLKVLCSQILPLITPHAQKYSYYRNIVLTECANRPSLYAFFKAIQEDDCADENEDENPKPLRQPLILPLALLFNDVVKCYDMKEVMFKLGLPISQLQKEIKAEAQNDRLYLPLLFVVETTLANVKIEQESPAAMQFALDNFIGEYGRLNPDTAARYFNIGTILLSQKDYDTALTCHYEALDIRLKLYGLNHADTADSYFLIGRAQFEKKDYKSALQSFEQALDIRQNIHGKIYPAVSLACHEIGVTKYRLKEYDSALHWYQQALDISVALYGKEHASSAGIYSRIANCQVKMQDYDSALESHQQALDIRLKLYGHNHADSANSYYLIGNTQLEKRDYKSALQSYEKALDMRQNIHGKVHPDISLSCNQIGVTKYRLKEYDSALHWHQQALDIRVALYGKEHTSSANSYSWYAECQYEMQDYDSALESCQQALDIRRKLYGHNHADTANSYYQIGRTQLEKKDYKSALQSFEQALDISQNLHGKIHPDVSSICKQIGVTKYRLKEYDSALHWHQQALDIRVALYGKKHPAAADSYFSIAECQCEMQNYDSALEACQQALDIRLKLYGHNHADTANSYYQIGRAQLKKKDYKSALQSYKKALDISQNLNGKIHPNVSSTCNEIGAIMYYLKEYDSALHWHQQALDIRVAFYGKEHPAAADSYFSIAECQCEMQDYDSALESCQQALDIRLKLFGQKSEATSDSYDQLEFIRSLKKVCQSSLELQSKNS